MILLLLACSTSSRATLTEALQTDLDVCQADLACRKRALDTHSARADALGLDLPLVAAERHRVDGLLLVEERKRLDAEASPLLRELARRAPSEALLAEIGVARERFEGSAAEFDFEMLYRSTLEALRTVRPVLPWTYTLVRPVDVPDQPPPTLKLLSKEANDITDVDAWKSRFGILADPSTPIGAEIRGAGGRMDPRRRFQIHCPDENGEPAAIFDLSAQPYAPGTPPAEQMFTEQEVQFAIVDAGVLYVSTGHRTYAASSRGQNAYITAFDVGTGELLWRSDPLVSNANNFVLTEGHLITGYGFTAEPDFLYLLSRRTGARVGKIPVDTGPEFLVRNGEHLLVRTYDRDYIFQITD